MHDDFTCTIKRIEKTSNRHMTVLQGMLDNMMCPTSD